VPGIGILFHVMRYAVLGERLPEFRRGTRQSAILAAETADHRARAPEQRRGVVGDPAVIGRRHGIAAARRQEHGEATAEAEADDADPPGAIPPTREPCPRRLDLVEAPASFMVARIHRNLPPR